MYMYIYETGNNQFIRTIDNRAGLNRTRANGGNGNNMSVRYEEIRLFQLSAQINLPASQ